MIELIPAIDIIGGQCVRLTKGDYTKSKVYQSDPVAQAKEFEQMGFKRLHVVDLDGAKSKHIVNHATVEQICRATSLMVDFGGGIKTDEDIEKAFGSGACMVTVGSIAATQPDTFAGWMEKYGTDKIILGADAKDGKIAVNGWKEQTSQDLFAFLDKYIGMGVNKVLCTDISKDGTMKGPNADLYERIMALHPTLQLIASGGVSSTEDILMLDERGIPAVVFGKAYYEGKIDIKHLMNHV